MMWRGFAGFDPAWMWFGMILWSVFWLALIGMAVYALVRVLGGRERPAIRILEERFARGEITAEQYRAMRQELERR